MVLTRMQMPFKHVNVFTTLYLCHYAQYKNILQNTKCNFLISLGKKSAFTKKCAIKKKG